MGGKEAFGGIFFLSKAVEPGRLPKISSTSEVDTMIYVMFKPYQSVLVMLINIKNSRTECKLATELCTANGERSPSQSMGGGEGEYG